MQIPKKTARLAVAGLTCASLVAGVGGPFASPAAATPPATFTWTMPDRFGGDSNGDGLVDYVDGTTDHSAGVSAAPSSWHADLDACATGADPTATYSWRVLDAGDAAHTPVISGGPGCADYDLDVPEEGTYRIGLTITENGVSRPEVVKEVVVQDWLVLSFGDSYGSGEGTPDQEVDQTPYREFEAAYNDWQAKRDAASNVQLKTKYLMSLIAKRDAVVADINRHCDLPDAHGDNYPVERCAGLHAQSAGLIVDIGAEAVVAGFKLVGDSVFALAQSVEAAINTAVQLAESAKHLVDTLRGALTATWQDERCHRSANAGSAQAARMLEQRDPRTSVTFVHLACSGASMVYGLLGSYTGVVHPDGLTNIACNSDNAPAACIPSQLEQAKALIGDREIDASYVSIGGNDAHFADIVVACIIQEPCNESTWVSDPIKVRDEVCDDYIPGVSHLCVELFTHLGKADNGEEALFRNAAELWEEGKNGDTTFPFNPMFQGHDALYGQLASALKGSGLVTPGREDRVLLSEYVDATQDDDGTLCGPEDGLGNIPGFSTAEFGWIAGTVEQELNANVATAAGKHGWTLVDGIDTGFAGHGYCADDHYLVRLQESFLQQGNKEGTVHPNVNGHAVYGRQILGELAQSLYGSATSVTDPRRPDQAPVADAGGPYALDEGSVVTLQHDTFDGDRDALTHEWTAPARTSLSSTAAATPVLTGLDDTDATLTHRVTDPDGTSVGHARVTVRNVAPTVQAGAATSVPEGQRFTGTAGFGDPGTQDTHTARVSYGSEPAVADDDDGTSVPLAHDFGDDGTYPVLVSVTDDDGGVGTDVRQVTVVNAAPSVGTITAPSAPQLARTAVTTVSAPFSDAGTRDTHTATWSWGDGTTSAGSVTGSAGSGTVAGSHTYAKAGVYTVTLTVTDDDGASATSTHSYVVTYDPAAGKATVSGTVAGPTGATAGELSLSAKYQKGESTPQANLTWSTGKDWTFHSKSEDWLVVTGDRALAVGTGTVNGKPGYTYSVSVKGGSAPAARIVVRKGTEVVYDNQPGAALDALPTRALTGTVTLG